MRFINGTVLNSEFKFVNSDIVIENDRITNIISKDTKLNDSNIFDCKGCYIIPGLVDVHTHGCANCESMNGTEEEIGIISKCMADHGVTSYLSTFETQSKESILNACKTIVKYNESPKFSAKIVGIHLEGPYFTYKYRGAQNEKYLRDPDIDEFNEFYKASNGLVKLISIAPECKTSIEFIKAVRSRCRISLGHTEADYDTAVKAIEAGADHLTHTFNGMASIHHRSPNAVCAAFDKDAFCEFIGDGVHVNYALIRLMYRLLGDDRMLFISDSIGAAGLPDGEYVSGGDLPFTVKNGKATMEDGTIMGSTAFIINSVQNAVKWGIPAESAVKMASLTPAKSIGMDNEIGSIQIGKKADLLITDKDFNILHIFIDGKMYK